MELEASGMAHLYLVEGISIPTPLPPIFHIDTGESWLLVYNRCVTSCVAANI